MPAITVRLDEPSRNRANALLPIVQVTDPGYVIDDVLSEAARIGLRRLASTLPGREVAAADLTTRAGDTVGDTTFTLAADLDTDTDTLATALGLPKAQVAGSAVVTGLALLSGVDEGPFTADGASRQFQRPFI